MRRRKFKRKRDNILPRAAGQQSPQPVYSTQEDPIGLAGGMNLYGYAAGDPINNSDPFGLNPLAIPVVGAGVIVAGVGLAVAAITIANGDELGAAIDNGIDAAARTGGALVAWANNKREGIHIRGHLRNINEHFDKLAGAGGPDDGDPNDPRNREKWKSDIRRAIFNARKRIERITGDRNRAPHQQAVDEAERRLMNTP